jgi:hypothetical protein
MLKTFITITLLISFNVKASLLLLIDLSVENQITFNATSGNSLVSISGSDNVGVYLDRIFFEDPGSVRESYISGTIDTNFQSGISQPDIFNSGGTDDDRGLNLYDFVQGNTITFSAGTRAFFGSATWGLESDDYQNALLGPSSGSIYAIADRITDLDLNSAVVIGTWFKGIEAPVEASEPSLMGLITALIFALLANSQYQSRKRVSLLNSKVY